MKISLEHLSAQGIFCYIHQEKTNFCKNLDIFTKRVYNIKSVTATQTRAYTETLKNKTQRLSLKCNELQTQTSKRFAIRGCKCIRSRAYFVGFIIHHIMILCQAFVNLSLQMLGIFYCLKRFHSRFNIDN